MKKKAPTHLVHEPDGDGLCRAYCALCRANLRAGLNPDGAPRTPGLAYLIKSRDGFWWRPKACGYTSSLLEAGIFTENKAIGTLTDTDRMECVVLARPHLERAMRHMQDRMEAMILVETGSEDL